MAYTPNTPPADHVRLLVTNYDKYTLRHRQKEELKQRKITVATRRTQQADHVRWKSITVHSTCPW